MRTLSRSKSACRSSFERGRDEASDSVDLRTALSWFVDCSKSSSPLDSLASLCSLLCAIGDPLPTLSNDCSSLGLLYTDGVRQYRLDLEVGSYPQESV